MLKVLARCSSGSTRDFLALLPSLSWLFYGFWSRCRPHQPNSQVAVEASRFRVQVLFLTWLRAANPAQAAGWDIPDTRSTLSLALAYSSA